MKRSHATKGISEKMTHESWFEWYKLSRHMNRKPSYLFMWDMLLCYATLGSADTTFGWVLKLWKHQVSKWNDTVYEWKVSSVQQ